MMQLDYILIIIPSDSLKILLSVEVSSSSSRLFWVFFNERNPKPTHHSCT